jgi:hypothetical protein
MSENVTQADREAAAKNVETRLMEEFKDWLPWMEAAVKPIRLGEQDNSAEVQAFAAHRRATVAKLEGAVFPILRRHKVTKRCFTEVAAATNAILVGKE